MEAYAPTTRKTHFEILKKIALTSQHFMCARQVSRKIDIFCGLCKRDKINLVQSHFLTLNFIFLYVTQKISIFFVKRLSEHTECRDIRAHGMGCPNNNLIIHGKSKMWQKNGSHH
jgi:hypothetical protein